MTETDVTTPETDDVAGRIKTTIRRIEALRNQAETLAQAFYSVAPAMYTAPNAPPPTDAISAGWRDAAIAVVDAGVALDELLEAIEEKAERQETADELVYGADKPAKSVAG